MGKTAHDLLLILVIAAVTVSIRALPFLVFREGRPVPKLVTELSSVLPAAVMGMLVIYCLRGVKVTEWPYGLPELIAVCAVAVCHIRKRNTLFSILLGTISYMLLLRFVF